MSNQTKNTATLSNVSMSAASTITTKLQHGKEPTIADLENLTFNDTPYDGGDAIKDLTFNQLADQSWSQPTKN